MAQELVWLDLEMTGLNPKKHRIIEIASIITDSELNIIAEGPDLVIHAQDEILERMNDFVHEMHRSSGLIEEVKNSKISIEEAEKETLSFLSRHTEKGRSPLCGNTISHDRRFLVRYMPELSAFFHYRNVDVSSLKEVVKRWHPHLADGYKKQGGHRAMADVIDSINELKYYKNHLFIPES